MARPILRLLVALALAGLCTSANAEIFTLKNGETFEATITEETATEYAVSIKVSASITDNRTILKSEVKSVKRPRPDEVLWAKLQNYKVGPNSLAAEHYEPIVQALTDFATQYLLSPHKDECRKRAAEFDAEKKRVLEGDVKISNNWFTKEQVQYERYQINATLTFASMQAMSSGGDPIGALNTFDTIEKQYPGARVYPDAVDLALMIVNALSAEIPARQSRLKTLTAQRALALQQGTQQERDRLKATLEREQELGEATLAAAEKRGLKWPPLINTNDKSLKALETKSTSELKRLSGIGTDKFRQSLKAADDAKKALENKDLESADAQIKLAQSLWSTNEIIARLHPQITAAKTAATARAAEEARRAQQPKAVTPVPAPKPTPTPKK